MKRFEPFGRKNRDDRTVFVSAEAIGETKT